MKSIQQIMLTIAIARMLRRLSDADDFLGSKVTMLLKNLVVLESNCTEKDYFCCEDMTENNDKKNISRRS
jgi:hypothetical protein